MGHDKKLSGVILGEYQVLGRLGSGGMGNVYEGLQPVIGKRVAIKVLHPELSENAETVERFLAEARAVNAIRHRGIIDIFSFGTMPNSSSHYFVMEFLDGEPFDRILKRRGPMSVGEALAHTAEVLDALDAVHSAGIVHRDLKPSNLFLVQEHRKAYVKLLDFGIAKQQVRDANTPALTSTSLIMGTPDYLSPEQVKGQAVTPQTDLYAMGLVLFELLTGKRQFAAENQVQLMWMQVKDDARPPSALVPEVPKAVDELVMWALEKEPSNRPASAREFLERVERLCERFPFDPHTSDLATGEQRARQARKSEQHLATPAPARSLSPTASTIPDLPPSPVTVGVKLGQVEPSSAEPEVTGSVPRAEAPAPSRGVHPMLWVALGSVLTLAVGAAVWFAKVELLEAAPAATPAVAPAKLQHKPWRVVEVPAPVPDDGVVADAGVDSPAP